MSEAAQSGGHVTRKSHKSSKRDKPKHSMMLQGTKRKGGAAKDGAGGKGTWGRPGDELTATSVASDSADPNYSSVDEGDDDPFSPRHDGAYVGGYYDWHAGHDVKQFGVSLADYARYKAAIVDATREYVVSHDDAEFVAVLRELALPIYNADLTYILFKFGLSRSATDREQLATLIRHLHHHTPQQLLTSAHIASGLHKLYEQMDDLAIDAPNVDHLLAEFAALLVAGGCITKAVVETEDAKRRNLKKNDEVATIKRQMDDVLNEFFESVDLDDLIQSIEEWNAPHLHTELIKKILSRSFDRGNRERELASRLLVELSPDIISREDVQSAFTILLQRVEDLVLDVPSIFRYMSSFLGRAVIDEVIPPAFLLRVDLNEHDAGMKILQAAIKLTKEPNAAHKMARVWADAELELKNKKSSSSSAPSSSDSTTTSSSASPSSTS